MNWTRFLNKISKFKKKLIPREVEEIEIKDQKIYVETYKSFIFDFNKFTGISTTTFSRFYHLYGFHFNTPLKSIKKELRKELSFDLKDILVLNKVNLDQILYFRLLHHQNAQTFRGFRHFMGLPANGQRTSSNSNNKKYNSRKDLITKIRRAERLSDNWA